MGGGHQHGATFCREGRKLMAALHPLQGWRGQGPGVQTGTPGQWAVRPSWKAPHSHMHALAHSLGVFRGTLPKAWFHVGRQASCSKSPGAAHGLGPGRHVRRKRGQTGPVSGVRG